MKNDLSHGLPVRADIALIPKLYLGTQHQQALLAIKLTCRIT